MSQKMGMLSSAPSTVTSPFGSSGAGAAAPPQMSSSLMLMSGGSMMPMPWGGQYGQGQLNYGSARGMPMNGFPATLNSNTTMPVGAGRGTFGRPLVGPNFDKNSFLRFAFGGQKQ